MSGGHFDYHQYKISNIADEIELYIDKCERKEKKDWGYTDKDGNYIQYIYEEPEEVLNQFREAVKALRRAFVYAHEVDWYLSGDTGEDSFLKRVKEGLDKIS